MASFEERGNSIRAVVRLPGGKKKAATFDTKAEAEFLGCKTRTIKSYGSEKNGVGHTVGSLFEAYLPVAGKQDSGKWNKLRLMKWLNDPISSAKVHETITHNINEWIDQRLNVMCPLLRYIAYSPKRLLA